MCVNIQLCGGGVFHSKRVKGGRVGIGGIVGEGVSVWLYRGF